MKQKKVTVIIPCHNEEQGLEEVIHDVPVARLTHLGYQTHIIVIDNNSTDRTSEVALRNNVQVVFEEKLGKGNAIKAGLRAISDDTDYIVMIDGDNTYKAKEIPRLIEPLESNFSEVIVGSRLGGKINSESLKFSNRVVNWMFTFLVRLFYRANVTDVLSGFFAWKRNVIVDLLPHIEANGFAVEMEMITKMVRLKHEIYSVPITYDLRSGESKISSFSDGIKIFYTLFTNLFWKPQKKSHFSKFKLINI